MEIAELIRHQRENLRILRDIQRQYSQALTEANAQLQEIQRRWENLRALLSQKGQQDLLQIDEVPSPPARSEGDPRREFPAAAERACSLIRDTETFLQNPPIPWQIAAIREIPGKIRPVSGVIAFSPDGRLWAFMLLQGFSRKEIVVWETTTNRWQRIPAFPAGLGVRVAFYPEGCFLVLYNYHDKVEVWNVNKGHPILNIRKEKVNRAELSHERQMLALIREDNTVEVWDVAANCLLHILRGHEKPVLDVAFSPDDQLLASGSFDKTIKVWNVTTGHLLHTFHKHENTVRGVAFSPNGHLLASGSDDRTVRIWDVAAGRLLHTLRGHENTVLGVGFSLNGQLLVSVSKDGTIKVWDVTAGRLLHTFGRHEGFVHVSFSPAGRLLALGSKDGSVKVWDMLGSPRLVQDLRLINEKIHCLSFSPDGNWLAVIGRTRVALVRCAWPGLKERLSGVLQAMAEVEDWYQRLSWQIQQDYRQRLDITISRLQNWQNDFQREHVETLPWSSPRWQAWSPTLESKKFLLRLGELQLLQLEARTPALLPFPHDRGWLFKVASTARGHAEQAVRSLLLRLLASLPPAKLRFIFIDPIGLGQNVAPFMHLADYDEQLITGKAWAEPQHIEQRLADLTEHMENVIQKYLRNQFATIEEYNALAGEVAEPYRVLVVFDFPTNFSETAARRLVSIMQNGPRCGVYAIVLVDLGKPLPYGFNLADLEQSSTVIAWDGQRFVWMDDDFRDCLLELDAPPEAELFNRIITVIGEAAKEAGKVEVPFERITLPPGQWWNADSRAGLSVPLGPAGARRLQHLELGKGTAQHVLVAGKTGSGKSTLLHVLITNLAIRYSPDEVQVYLVDFKKGVEFKPYATYQLPHARVVAIESEREFGLSVLQGLDAELKRRGDLFRNAGVDYIADYRTRTGQKMPRILLIVDEFQEFFVEDDAIASQAAQILDRLVRQGRAFGIHVLLGSQTLAGSYALARSTIDQMAVRIALQCSEADSRLILADDNPAARLLSRPGEAIYNDANGLVEGNHPFQVAWLSDEQREAYLQRIIDFATQKGYRPSQPQIVFEGSAPGQIEQNRPLRDLLVAPSWPPGLRRYAAWLGEPVAIADPVAAYFRRQSASNLMVVGQQDEQAAGVMVAALLSLAAQHAPSPEFSATKEARFYFLDFGAVDAPYAEIWSQLAGILPHQFHLGRRRQLPEIIGEIAAEVQQRLDDEVEAVQRPEIYLTIFGLQRARDLRVEEDFSFSSFGSDEQATPKLSEQFATILREGPDLGVHTLIWCDTYTNLTRVLDRRSLREFDIRVVFQMNAEDSASLIDTPAAGKLGAYRVFLYSEEESQLKKFRPYGVPSAEWLKWVEQRFKEKDQQVRARW